jgi:tetratricopeptide (TPR) repeat protein
MNVRDYSVMQEILPEQIHVLRLYAKFLGEKSLSADDRKKILAEIEFKEFERARQEFKSAENAFMYMRLSEASKHYEACLNILGQLKFYQDLQEGAQIDPLEFVEMQKTSHLKLAKCRLRMERDLYSGEEHLWRYLKLEQNVAAVSDLETYLMRWGSLGDKLEDSMDDLRLLYFHMYLYYKENRYREIMRVGSLLQKSFVVIPESEQKLYTEILQIVGDAYQKVDYIYDAEEFYKMALNFEPNNLKILLSMRKNYEHVRDEEGVNTVNEKLKEVLSQEETSFQDYVIQKGKRFLQTFILDGSPLNVSLHFSQINEDITPLITIFFNGRAVWENYLEEDVLSLPLEPIEGRNELVILPLNTDVKILGINHE